MTIKWGEVQRAFIEHDYWQGRVNQFETEKQQRTSMAFGSLLFVILGAPVGILFAKRDFLSAFMSCFLPIITLYYPLMLFGINLGKEGTLDPGYALWIGNAVLHRAVGVRLSQDHQVLMYRGQGRAPATSLLGWESRHA